MVRQAHHKCPFDSSCYSPFGIARHKSLRALDPKQKPPFWDGFCFSLLVACPSNSSGWFTTSEFVLEDERVEWRWAESNRRAKDDIQ